MTDPAIVTDLKLSPDQVGRFLECNIRAGIPTWIWGPPGVGKTAIVQQTARRLFPQSQNPLFVFFAGQADAVETRGIPYVCDGRAYWAPDSLWPDADREGDGGIFFLDDYADAPKAVHSALYSFILQRRLGGYTLPPGWQFVAASNDVQHRAGAGQTSTASRGRFLHCEMTPSLDDWCSWAIGADIPVEIIGYLRQAPAALHEFDPLSGAKAWPDPRRWEQAARAYAARPDPDLELAQIAGAVGIGRAAECVAWCRLAREMMGRFSIDGILMDPDGAPVPEPEQSDVAFMLSAGLAQRATAGNFDAILQYCSRLPREYAAATFSAAKARDPSLITTHAAVKWLITNQHLLTGTC